MVLLCCVCYIVFVYRVLLNWKLVRFLSLNGFFLLCFFLLFLTWSKLSCRSWLFLFYEPFVKCGDSCCADFALVKLESTLLSVFWFGTILISCLNILIRRPVFFSFRFQLNLKIAKGLSFLLDRVLFGGLCITLITGTQTRHIWFFPVFRYFHSCSFLYMLTIFAHFLAMRSFAYQRVSFVPFTCWIKAESFAIGIITWFWILTECWLDSDISESFMHVAFFVSERGGSSGGMVVRMILFGWMREFDGELIWVKLIVLRFLNIFDLICLILLFFLACLGERLSGRCLVCATIRFG